MEGPALVEIDYQGWIVASAHRDPTDAARRLRVAVRSAGGTVFCTRYIGEVPEGAPSVTDPVGFVPGLGRGV